VVKFTAEQMQYDLEEFLGSGQDDHGNSVRMQFRCPPVVERELEIILSSKRFPYKTPSDIVRHAVYRHLHWLHEMEPEIPRHHLAGLEAINEVMRDTELRAQTEKTFVKLDQMIEERLAAGEHQEALRLIQNTKQRVIALSDSRWRRIWLERFKQKYARYLGGTAAAVEDSGQ
jgi:hypothetical protein